jgi:segregation and condensation protein B
MARLASTIEAILYLKAQALTLTEIAEFAGCPREEAEEGLLELMADYTHRDTALEVAETDLGYCLQLREDFQALVQTIIPADIGKGSLRTLAVIALKGPMIQTDLINLRGSGAYQHVQELVEQGFVRKRRKSDGRSYWLQVTEKFNQYFQLNKLVGNLDQFLSKAVVPDETAVEGQSAESGADVPRSAPDSAPDVELAADPVADPAADPFADPAAKLGSGPAAEPTAGANPGIDPADLDDDDIEEEVAGSISDAMLEANAMSNADLDDAAAPTRLE